MWGLRSQRFSPKINILTPQKLKKNLKIVEAVLDVRANQYSQSIPNLLKMGRIGCAGKSKTSPTILILKNFLG